MNPDYATTNPGGAVNISVLANDSAAAGLDTASLALLSNPSSGTATVQGGGKIRYRAANDFTGQVVFSYRICDLNASCGSALIVVTIE